MMKKKLASMVLAASMAAAALSGCAPTTSGKAEAPAATAESTSDSAAPGTEEETAAASEGGEEVVVWNLKTDQNSWDPPYVYTAQGVNLTENLYEGLLCSTTDGIVPGNAESYEVSEDKMVYTFHLRDGLKWSDGTPITAEDYVYSWRRVCSPETASEYSYIMYPYIKGGQEAMSGTASPEDIGVTAVDEKTLQVELTSPVPFFPELAAFIVYRPVKQEIVEANGEGWEKNPETCVTNGAYKVTEYQMGSHMLLEKNENYWDAQNVKIDKIKIVFLAEDTTALNAYESGEIQVLSSVPTDEIVRLKTEDPNFAVQYKASTPHLAFNVDKEPVNDVNVRKALSLAIDRVKLTEQVLKGGEIPATGIIPPSFTYSDGTSCRKLDENGKPAAEFFIDPYDADMNIELAKQCLADAGYPNGEGLPEIELSVGNSENSKKRAEAIIEMWKQNLNINAKIVLLDAATGNDTIKHGRYMVSIGGFTADYIDPVAMLECFMSTSVNNNCLWRWQPLALIPEDTLMNPENKQFDEDIEKSMSADGAERDALLKDAESVLIENVVVAPLYYAVNTEIIDQSVITGVTKTKNGSIIFKTAKLAE